MGACASVPKSMQAGAGKAPPPEPAREETEVEEVKAEREVIKTEEGGLEKPKEEKKAEGHDDKERENVKVVVEDDDQNKDGEKEVDENDNCQSLETLLNEHQKTIPSETVQKPEEPKTEEVSIAKELAVSEKTIIPSETVEKPEEPKNTTYPEIINSETIQTKTVAIPIAKETPETPKTTTTTHARTISSEIVLLKPEEPVVVAHVVPRVQSEPGL